MKAFLYFFVAALFIPLVNIAQYYEDMFPINDETQKITYSTIGEIKDKSQTKLYDLAKAWISSKILTEDNSLILDDKEAGKMIAKGGFRVEYVDKGLLSSCGLKYNLVYTIKVFIKENRYKCEITDLKFQKYKSGGYTGVYWGYGMYTGKARPDEVIEYDLEDYYPVEKKQSCKNSWENIFQDIDKEIKEITESLRIAMNEKDDW